MTALSRAQQFYQSIIDAKPSPAHFLEDLVTQGKSENDFLEFKGAGRIPESTAKAYWSKALAGFANTEGGVLIWGIRAAPMEDPPGSGKRVDAANGLDFVPDPSAFSQMLKDVRLEATIDPVAGVEIAWYPATSATGGFVVCFVPESDFKPHRAELDAGKQYYQRIGDKFVVLPHSILRSLFYPRLSPKLLLYVNISRNISGVARSFLFHAFLSNNGKASARDPFGYLFCDVPLSGFEWVDAIEDRFLNNPVKTHRSFHLGRPLHPGGKVTLFRCIYQEPITPAEVDWLPSVGEIVLQVTMVMLDQPEQNLRSVF